MTTLSPDELIEAHRQLAALEAQHRVLGYAHRMQLGREQLIPFVQHTMPDIEEPENPFKSRYIAARPHRAIAAVLEEIEAGRYLRVILVTPPRHGKTELASRRFIPWVLGKDPYRSVIFATYGGEFAEDIGREVREVFDSREYQEVFPGCRLRTGSKSAQRLVTTRGGGVMFVGRGGAITGRGADFLIIDDPIKDAEEADSPTIRNKLWDWFTRTAATRLMTAAGRIIVIQTRWHEDDLVGRLTDPNNPCYSANEAKKWKIIHLPALAGDDDPLGRPNGEPLWPERFGVDYLSAMRDLDGRGFSALYQGRPTPEDGDEFKKEYIRTYQPHQLPKNLRVYVASDHAVGTDQKNDLTCIVIGGIDESDTLWITDVWWRRAPTDVVVEAMLDIMRRYEPSMWWAEKGHISKSIGPFLRKRMMEEKVYAPIDEVTPIADKVTRAQSIRGRMAMGKVMFPAFMPWFQNAKSELLKFPNDLHDDFVDALAHLGRGLAKQLRALPPPVAKREPTTGTLGWVKWQTRMAEDAERALKNASGF